MLPARVTLLRHCLHSGTEVQVAFSQAHLSRSQLIRLLVLQWCLGRGESQKIKSMGQGKTVQHHYGAAEQGNLSIGIGLRKGALCFLLLSGLSDASAPPTPTSRARHRETHLPQRPHHPLTRRVSAVRHEASLVSAAASYANLGKTVSQCDRLYRTAHLRTGEPRKSHSYC